MATAALIATDVVAITALSYGVYFRRHRRRDMALAYTGLNLGVMAVTLALSSATVGAGLGLGLFGVLSIIRLRSAELTQAEVAYYFVSLAMGLVAGLAFTPAWTGPALVVGLVAVLFVADHPDLLGRYRHQTITLDRAYADEGVLARELESLLGADVKHVIVNRLDLVRDTTTVDVRYRLRTPGGPAAVVVPPSPEVRTAGSTGGGR